MTVRDALLSRHQYAFNNPTTNWGPDGHFCSRKAPGLPQVLYGTCWPNSTPISEPSHGGGYIHALPQNPTYGTQGGKTPDAPAKPKANGPNSQNDVSARHQRDMWITVSDVLGVLGGVFGFLSLIPGPQQPIFAALSVISSLGGTIISCILGGDQLASCIIGIILSAIPAVGASAKAAFRGVLVDAVNGAVNAIGRMGDGLGIVTGGGDLVTRNR
ncbi:hypothetical protein [Leifsonia aquatica]|uniref:hypothetical protein n=1 Tax=Leifsonia aquatica TaxID=144185 RepID=UPI00382C31B8